ncbi:MAG: peroxiredoxin [Balneolaceae bacterium]
MIEVGAKMDTNFTFKVVEGEEEREVSFADVLSRPTIVSVYMKNNTSSCDKQNISLAEHASWFDEAGYNLVTISKDTCGSHKKYIAKHGIGYMIASDPEYKFSSATDSIVEKKMYGKVYEGPSRSAFVIDTDGTILAAIEKIDTKAHAEELKDVIGSLN